MISLKQISAVAAVVFAFGTVNTASASSCSSPYDAYAYGDISGSNSGCELGSTNNDNLNPPPSQVNRDVMFGRSDWIFAGKDIEIPAEPGDVNVGFSADFDGQSIGGTWQVLSSFFDTYDELMLVFKGGAAQTPSTYIGYLFVENDGTSGGWTQSPFTGQVSHISAYVRECDILDGPECGKPGSPVVPVPAGLPLMLTVLGVGAYIRKRARKSA